MASVSRSAFKVMLGSIFSLLGALASQVLIASLFGAGVEMDAFLTALVVPVYLQAVLLSGLSFVLIPAFVEEVEKGSEKDAWALTGTFFWLIGGVLAAIAILGSVYSERIIAFYAPELSASKGKLAASMLTVQMFVLPLSGLGSLTVGIQNARNRFLWPALAPAIGSLCNVVILLLLYRRLGPISLSWGYFVSEAAIAAVTIIPVLRHGWERMMSFSDRRVIRMVKLILPFVIFGLFTRATNLFERYYASGLPDGDLSYLGYASKVSRIFMSLLGVGIATAVFPSMARAYTRAGVAKLVEEVEFGLRLSLAVALPVFAISTALSEQMVTVFFERGAFGHTTALKVSRIVPAVILGAVVLVMVHNIIRRTFYVTKDTHTVPMVDALSSVFYILVASKLVRIWGYVGLAVATPLYSGLDILVLLLIIIRRLGNFPVRKLLKYLLFYGLASLTAFLAAWLTARSMASMQVLPQLLVASLIAGLIYWLFLYKIDQLIAVSVLEMMGVHRLFNHMRVKFYRTAEALPGKGKRT